jgi:hypothetical protein
VPCLVYCTIVCSILKTYRGLHSDMDSDVDSTTVIVNGITQTDGECQSKQCIFFIPRHFISFSVLITTDNFESRNNKLVNNMCYTEFRCKVFEQ